MATKVQQQVTQVLEDLTKKRANALAFEKEAARRGPEGRFMNHSAVYWHAQADAFTTSRALVTAATGLVQ